MQTKGRIPHEKPCTPGLHDTELGKTHVNGNVAFHAAETFMFKADGAVFMSAKVPMADDPPCLRAFRDEVSLCVIKSAQQLYPHDIKFHFNTQVQEVDLTRQTVSVSFGESTTTQVCCITWISLKDSCVRSGEISQHCVGI